ncbi:addiction module antidote protein [Candidatus Margulisiibacteriota bacterium]
MRNFRTYLIDKLKDPAEAIAYLKTALEEYEKDKNLEAFLLAIRTIAEAKGGIAKLAERTNLNRQNLYRALSASGNPRLNTLEAVLHGLGFKLSVEPIKSIHKPKIEFPKVGWKKKSSKKRIILKKEKLN